MSLPLEMMVNGNKMEHAECILCGACAGGCHEGANELPRSKLRGIRNSKERSKLRGIYPERLKSFQFVPNL
jgi:ferredoxin